MSDLSPGGIPACTVSVASYNIHRCFGTDRKYLPERVAEVLQSLDADIIGLQEVDLRLLVDGRPQLQYLGETLLMETVAGPSFHDHRGHFGNAMLTRLPVRTVRRADLSVRNFEPRGAIDVELDYGGRPLRVIVTHLGLKASERRLQVRRLLHMLDNAGQDMPTVMMGDFNEWRPTGGSIHSLNRRFGHQHAARSFPSRFPLLPLDRIWVWPAIGLKRIGVYASPMTRLASDHLPIRAVLSWENSDLPHSWSASISIT